MFLIQSLRALVGEDNVLTGERASPYLTDLPHSVPPFSRSKPWNTPFASWATHARRSGRH